MAHALRLGRVVRAAILRARPRQKRGRKWPCMLRKRITGLNSPRPSRRQLVAVRACAEASTAANARTPADAVTATGLTYMAAACARTPAVAASQP